MTIETIQNEGSTHKYFGAIPHMAGAKLDVYEHRLYAHYVEVCGLSKTDRCFQAERTIYKACGMSKQRFLKARQGLIDKKFITFQAGRPNKKSQKGFPARTTIIDIWEENIAFCKKRPYTGQILPVEGVNNYPLKGSDITPSKKYKNLKEIKDSPEINSGSGTGDDEIGYGECPDCGNPLSLDDMSHCYDCTSKAIAQHVMYPNVEFTNPPTPPTPHERYEALELTAGQVKLLEHLAKPNSGNSGDSVVYDNKPTIAWLTEVGYIVMGYKSNFDLQVLVVTDTGRAALEDYRKCCEPQQSTFTCFDCKQVISGTDGKHYPETGLCGECISNHPEYTGKHPIADCTGTEHINPAVLCEVVKPTLTKADVNKGDSVKLSTGAIGTVISAYKNDVLVEFANGFNDRYKYDELSLCEAVEDKPAPKKGRAKAICSKCGKKARKVVEDGMCWECNGYPDRAAMIDIIYARLGWPNTNTMYKSNNTKVATTLAQWGATLKNLDRYVDEMIVVSQSQNWTLTINALSNESRFLTWLTEDKATNYIDAPLYAEPKPRPESPLVIMTPDELAELEERVRKQMTELPEVDNE